MKALSVVLNGLLLLALIAFTLEQTWAPPEWWIVFHKMYIPDIYAGDPSPTVAIDDVIKRTFVAEYSIDIRKLGAPATAKDKPDLSRFTYYCSGHGRLAFRPGSDPAANLNLDWWTQNSCKSFPEGSYYAQIILTWRDFLATQSTTIISNVFSVSAPIEPVAPVIVQTPAIVIEKKIVQTVTKVVPLAVAPRAGRPRPRCEPSLFPPRFCPEPGRPSRNPRQLRRPPAGSHGHGR